MVSWHIPTETSTRFLVALVLNRAKLMELGHQVPTMIGVEQQDIAKKSSGLVPDYMVMGEKGMADMGAMEMPLPANTLPMMTGQGPFGAIEMGGMFTVVKVREGLARNDYKDPGWYKHPDGTVAYRVDDKRA